MTSSSTIAFQQLQETIASPNPRSLLSQRQEGGFLENPAGSFLRALPGDREDPGRCQELSARRCPFTPAARRELRSCKVTSPAASNLHKNTTQGLSQQRSRAGEPRALPKQLHISLGLQNLTEREASRHSPGSLCMR